MKLAIMQPYLFPYLGYVQLMHAVDTFVLYDDVNFIKQGWVNRNTILSAQGPQRLTLELKGASPNKNINEIMIGNNRLKMLRSVDVNYRRAPHFVSIMPFVEECLTFQTERLSDLLEFTLRRLAKLLNLNTKIFVSSQLDKPCDALSGQDRVIAICNSLGAAHYINAEGGMGLYSSKDFAVHNIKLSFLRHSPIEYPQFAKLEGFVSHLSVLDVLMFVGVEDVKKRMADFQLVEN